MVMTWRCLLVALFASCIGVAGCISPHVVVCGDGRVCPPATVCDDANQLCVSAEQLRACDGLLDDAPCALPDGLSGNCRNGTCVAAVCGDGLVTGGEQCEADDVQGQTCLSLGYYDASGVISCNGYCRFEVSGCTGFCGDRIVNGAEACDGKSPAVSCQTFGYDEGVIDCLSLCQPDVTNCYTPDGVAWIAMTSGTPQRLNTVWGTGPTDVFAGGTGGTIVHYDGSTWTVQATGTNLEWKAIWGSSSSDVYAVGIPSTSFVGAVLHFNGTTWSTVTVPSITNPQGIWGSGPNDIYVVGGTGSAGGAMLHYNGTWSTVTIPAVGGLRKVWGATNSTTGKQEIFAVGSNGILHFDGTSWSVMSASVGGSNVALNAVWGSATNDVFAAGQVNTVNGSSTILHYDGNTWSLQNTPTQFVLTGLWGTGPRSVVAVAQEQHTILRYDGTTWSRQSFDVDASALQAVWGTGFDDVFAVGSNGTIKHYSAVLWATMNSSVTVFGNNIDGIWGDTATNVFGVGYGTVVNFNGQNWAGVGSGGLHAVWGSGPLDVVAVGDLGSPGSSGIVRHYKAATPWDRTSVWPLDPIPSVTSLYGVWGSASNDIFAVGGAGTVIHYNGTWQSQPSGTTASLAAVWGSSGTDVFAVGGHFGTGNISLGDAIHYDGTQWSPMTLPTGTASLRGAWGTSGTDVFAVGDDGTIVHYDGVGWSPQISTTTSILRSVWGTGPANVFAAGDSGTLLHYDGTSWSAQTSSTGTDLRAVGGARGRVFAAGEQGATVLVRSQRCAATETRCSLAEDADDDCDGLFGCVDADCSADPTCMGGGLCSGAATLACGSTVSATTVGGPLGLRRYACTDWQENGNEAHYQIVSPTTGNVTVTLRGLSKDLDVIVLDKGAGGGCEPRNPGCRAASTQSGSVDETVTFSAQANRTYFIVVDGYASNAGSFTLEAACP